LQSLPFELLLSKIESIGVDEGLMGRMLGYGTVTVRGTGGTPEPFARILHPMEFRRQVQQQVESSEQNKVSREKVFA
jgi:Bacterial PH domain